jgi:hypothetical protein
VDIKTALDSMKDAEYVALAQRLLASLPPAEQAQPRVAAVNNKRFARWLLAPPTDPLVRRIIEACTQARL